MDFPVFILMENYILNYHLQYHPKDSPCSKMLVSRIPGVIHSLNMLGGAQGFLSKILEIHKIKMK